MTLPPPLLLPLLLLSLSPARAAPNFQRFRWGDLSAVVLSDGPFDFCGTPFVNMSPSDYLSALSRLHRRPSPLRRAINVLVADVAGKRFLVDTGALFQSTPRLRLDFFLDAGLLMHSMALAGITPHSIDAVLLTHGHFDHVLGLRTLQGKRAFPNAHVYISKREHHFWMHPTNNTDMAPQFVGLLSSLYQASVAPYVKANRLHVVTSGATPFRGVRFRQSRGHSPGHMSIELGVRAPRLVATGDVWMISGIQLKRLDVVGAIESNRGQLVKNRRKLLRRLSKNGNLVLTYHETFPGLGFVEADGQGGYDWITAPIEELDGKCSLQCRQ